MEQGIDALRINPGNIGSRDNVVKVVDMAREKQIPIRIGINAGSLPQHILDAYGGHPTAEGMVAGAMEHVKILEEENFHDIVISVKSTDVPMMVKANRLLHEKVNYPLHLGVTEAGTLYRGTIKSAIGIGSLLLDGIGDTIRVSLTDDPLKEVKAAKEILSSVGMQQYGPVLVSCPTCGRTQVDLIHMAQEVRENPEIQETHPRSRHGLRCQWSRRSQRSRLRHSRWKRQRPPLQKRKNPEKRAGRRTDSCLDGRNREI